MKFPVFAAVGTAVAFAACGDVTSPRAGMAEDVRLDSATVAGLSAALEDARVRLAPALGDLAGASELNVYLADVNDLLARGKTGAAVRRLGKARQSLTALRERGEGAGAAADLDGIAWALDQVELAVQMPAKEQRQNEQGK
jgi:hypothetical protein